MARVKEMKICGVVMSRDRADEPGWRPGLPLKASLALKNALPRRLSCSGNVQPLTLGTGTESQASL